MKYSPLFGWDRDEHARRVRHLRRRRLLRAVALSLAVVTVVVAFRRCVAGQSERGNQFAERLMTVVQP